MITVSAACRDGFPVYVNVRHFKDQDAVRSRSARDSEFSRSISDDALKEMIVININIMGSMAAKA
jgi:hypothetical protein